MISEIFAQMLRELEIGLNNEYSPEQITGRAKLDDVSCVSHECIYQYIWKDKKQSSRLSENSVILDVNIVNVVIVRRKEVSSKIE